MLIWLEVLVISLSSLLAISIFILFLRRRFASRNDPPISDQPIPGRLHRRGGSSKTALFNWADHPSLITDAVENGWSRFAFTNYTSSPSVRSSLFGSLRVAEDNFAEVSWEVGQGSADFMQKIRLNTGLIKKITAADSSTVAKSVIRTALPLPGPPLGNFSFPQQAYFEIIILKSSEDDEKSMGKNKIEGEKTKLINEKKNNSINSSSCSSSKVMEESPAVNMTVGLVAGGASPGRIPGSYGGSIGFNSNGSVYLAGNKLVFESEKEDWTRTGKVVGCGFDPTQKKVFFTVDSNLVHMVHCKSEEFSTPLYPVLASNIDITVLVNFGQTMFQYEPANGTRNPNPCFVRPMGRSPAGTLGYEDSRELFSMGRIDSEWLSHCGTVKSTSTINNENKGGEFDDESEADLFEIVLDTKGRSPITVTNT